MKFNLNNLKIDLGILKIDFSFKKEDKQAAYSMYIELVSRITTQPLDENAGDEETALNSIFSLFKTTREVLVKNGPESFEFSKIALEVLNKVIRPFTAKYHKVKINGGFKDQSVCAEFRNDLRELQQYINEYIVIIEQIIMS